MIINQANLEALRVNFKTNFQGGLGQAAPMYERVATRVPSTTKENRYGWLNKVPGLREWIGDRVINSISETDYAIRNKPFEQTIGVDRDDIEDDNLGVYAPLFTEMGMATAAHPDEMVWPLLAAGFDVDCYDGQTFFDDQHPVLDKDGNTILVSNVGGGSSTPWFLLSTKRALKPLIFQQRKAPEFVAKDDPRDDNVFMRKEYLYGVECRDNVGFGFWQMAFASEQTLNATNYEAARAFFIGQKGDHGRPLGIMPDLLVVPGTLEGAAKRLLQSQLVNGGESNPWAGSAELLVVPWL